MNQKYPVLMLYGVSVLFGVIALICLFSGAWGGFFGFLVFCLGFGGFGWATRRHSFPRENENPGEAVPQIALVIFGGAGVVMLIGSVFLFADEQVGGGVGLGVFGLIFCGIGYLGSKAFSVPKGQKEVLVSQERRSIRYRNGMTGERTLRRFVRVDAGVSAEEVAARQKRWAEEPWTVREDWVAGMIEQEGRGTARFLAMFTVLWNLFSWVFAGLSMVGESGGIKAIPWVLLIFPAIGLALIVLSVREGIRQRKFGASVLHTQSVPSWLGGEIAGMVRTRIKLRGPLKDFSVRLACVREGTGRRNDRTEQVLWQRTEAAQGQVVDGWIVAIPVKVAIPDDLPPTGVDSSANRILWRLSLTYELPGVDYVAAFEIPVFPSVAAR